MCLILIRKKWFLSMQLPLKYIYIREFPLIWKPKFDAGTQEHNKLNLKRNLKHNNSWNVFNILFSLQKWYYVE